MPYNPCKNEEAWAIRELIAKNLKERRSPGHKKDATEQED